MAALKDVVGGADIAAAEGLLFGADCADADVAQAITVTNAKAVMDIFLDNELPMPTGGRALTGSQRRIVLTPSSRAPNMPRGRA